ncbi:MAG: lipocalin-like domain-containing protein [Staphylococcus sp.]|nr:lipocalin-like domain-containing protein [Staphylococcus sp.]
MRKIIIISAYFLLLGLIVPLTGCTRHNGDIGDLFGEWRLERMTADGVDVDLYGQADEDGVELYTWAFQSTLIRINSIYPHHHSMLSMGTWSEDGDILSLKFGYSDNVEGNESFYIPPAVLQLRPDGVTRLHFDSRSGKKMVLSQTADDGVTYTYYLSHPH